VGDEEGADADAENATDYSVQREVERQDLSVRNRWDHTRQEGSPQADHHERNNWMACDHPKHR
jgi:hypothetical protein